MPSITINFTTLALERAEDAFGLTGGELKAEIKRELKLIIEKKEVIVARSVSQKALTPFDFNEGINPSS